MIKQELKQPEEDEVALPWGWIGAIIAVAYIAAVWIAYIVNEKVYSLIVDMDPTKFNVTQTPPNDLSAFIDGSLIFFAVLLATVLFIYIYNKIFD